MSIIALNDVSYRDVIRFVSFTVKVCLQLLCIGVGIQTSILYLNAIEVDTYIMFVILVHP